jgi:hypothetical protein
MRSEATEAAVLPTGAVAFVAPNFYRRSRRLSSSSQVPPACLSPYGKEFPRVSGCPRETTFTTPFGGCAMNGGQTG